MGDRPIELAGTCYHLLHLPHAVTSLVATKTSPTLKSLARTRKTNKRAYKVSGFMRLPNWRE